MLLDLGMPKNYRTCNTITPHTIPVQAIKDDKQHC